MISSLLSLSINSSSKVRSEYNEALDAQHNEEM